MIFFDRAFKSTEGDEEDLRSTGFKKNFPKLTLNVVLLVEGLILHVYF